MTYLTTLFLASFSLSILNLLVSLFGDNTDIRTPIVGFIVTVVVVVVANRRYRKFFDHRFTDATFDKSARNYIEGLEDLYKKKFINSIFFAWLYLAYLIFSVWISIAISKYTLPDVMQQVLYSGLFFEIIFYQIIKNYRCRKTITVFFTDQTRKNYNRQIKRVIVASAIYFLVDIGFMILFRNEIDAMYNMFLLSSAVYILAALIYNLTARKEIVFRNIKYNLKKMVCYGLIIALYCGYNLMAMDLYLTQSYINKVVEVPRVEDQISYDKSDGVYTVTTDKSDFKILQLTDIHLGGSIMSVWEDTQALEACYKLIEDCKPDLVVVTGDLVFPMGVMSFSLNNNAPVMQFANFMRNTGIPWAFTYGNHDTEAMATLNTREFANLLESIARNSGNNLLYPLVQPDIYGRSNQMIQIRNKDNTLRQALFLIDSNDYIPQTSKINEYDYIRNDQVEWYKNEVLSLSEKEGYTIPSMAFFHIPLQQYRVANDLYESGSKKVKYFYGEIGETMIDKICASKYPSQFFDTAVELGSTKAMFCGHDHYNNQSLEYKGIRLTYGYSIDYLAMPGIKKDTEQRGATLITLDKQGDYRITPRKLKDLK